MKVLLVGNYASDGQHSMLSFPTALKAGLADLGIDASITTAKPRFGGGGGKLSKWAAYVDKFLVYPRELRRLAKKSDVVHVCDQGNALYVNWLRKKPHLVTCHDVLAIRSALGELAYWHTGPTGKIFQRLNRKALGRARLVACVSDATLADCRRILALPDDRLRLVWNGIYKSLDVPPSVVATAALQGAGVPNGVPFLLQVGGNQPYKNRPGAVEFYRQLRLHAPDRPLALILAGEVPPADLSIEGVASVASPSDALLAALYSRAEALVVSSFNEGFGLPILEAQGCGCPIIVNDKPPMNTVAGNGALRVDFGFPQEAAIATLAGWDSLPAQRESGLANARGYSLARMADGYAQLYRELGEGGA